VSENVLCISDLNMASSYVLSALTAHVHHAYESYLAGGRTKKALIQGCLVSSEQTDPLSQLSPPLTSQSVSAVLTAFQFAYTTLFGWYATYLFLRTGMLLSPPSPLFLRLIEPLYPLNCTGSIIPPFLAHAFCNSMGLPPLSYALQVYPDRKLCRSSSTLHVGPRLMLGFERDTAIWTSYLGGIGLFIYGFWRWTEPGLFGGSLYWL